MLKKELKMKQHTLSTFEYIMKMPADEQVRAIFCKRCHRAFREKKYVARHYAKFHAEQSYELDYASDEEREASSKKASTKEVDQEELFKRIKSELFGSLDENFRKLETDMQGIKQKQQEAEKVKDMLQSYEQKNEEEKSRLQESL